MLGFIQLIYSPVILYAYRLKSLNQSLKSQIVLVRLENSSLQIIFMSLQFVIDRFICITIGQMNIDKLFQSFMKSLLHPLSKYKISIISKSKSLRKLTKHHNMTIVFRSMP